MLAKKDGHAILTLSHLRMYYLKKECITYKKKILSLRFGFDKWLSWRNATEHFILPFFFF